MIDKKIEQRLALKQKFANREKTFGGWVSFREPSIAEIFTKVGFDFLCIDMEHTTISIDDANRIITSVQSEGGICIPRQVSHNNDYMKPLLEAGADGIMMPMVNSKEEVNAILNNFKFPPHGRRSFGINRAHGYGADFEKYISTWNDCGLFTIQIESIQAVNNIEEIVKIPEIDAVMIGPYDISGSLDVPGQTNHPKVRDAAQKVISACRSAGISCLTQIASVSEDAIEDAFEQGFTSVIMGSDLFALWQWSENMRKIVSGYR
jgi:2-dehydro-3-deoxyglucarate aldolase